MRVLSAWKGAACAFCGSEHTPPYRSHSFLTDEASPTEGIPIGRAYGRFDRALLRSWLAGRCAAGRVRFLPCVVSSIDSSVAGASVLLLTPDPCSGHAVTPLPPLTASLVVCCSGHNRELVAYEAGQPPGWQTAYGLEMRLPDHPFPLDKVVFMDFRQADPEPSEAEVAATGGAWRVPSFLYVMPTDRDTVFVQETCLMSRVQVPFDELKRRLLRRLERTGVPPPSDDAILEVEASWIPLGGGVPVVPQRTLAFGAAAGLVHPGSGFSVVRSLQLAPPFADAVASRLRPRGSSSTGDAPDGAGADAASSAAWGVLWGPEARRRMGFHQFGMELLLSLRLHELRGFFTTFYSLPRPFSEGFLSHRLSSSTLLAFAAAFFIAGDNALRWKLVSHLASPAGSGRRLLAAYLGTPPPPAPADAIAPLPHHPPPALSSPDASNGHRAGAVAVVAGGSASPRGGMVVHRESPPQPPAAAVSAAEQAAHEAAGMRPGYASRDWWVVRGKGDDKAAAPAGRSRKRGVAGGA